MGDNTQEITDQNYAEIVKKNPNLIIDCWAPWCGPCRMIGPLIDALAAEYKGKVVIGKLNTDDNFETATTLEIMAIPTIVFYKNGEAVDKIVGAVSKEAIISSINNNLLK